MLCSASELGLAQTSEGILELPQDAPIAADVRDYLQLNDVCIDIDLTPNRGDCASVLGIAREVAAINNMPLHKEMVAHVKATIKDTLPITLSASKGCARYVGRIIKGINTNISSPVWLTEKLRRSGIRSIHPIVDVTNLVMLELGVPMHALICQPSRVAFTCVMHKLVKDCYYSRQEQTLAQRIYGNQLMMKKALAIAGIMGREHSAVSRTTTNILFECAYFE